MRVLVTGGTGYLGRAVVQALAAAGHEPVVFARTAAASGLPGALVNGDVRHRAALHQAADGCEAICHMAALVSLWRRRAQDFDEVNVGGLEHVLAVAGARGIPRVLYTSSFLALPPSDGLMPLRTNDYQRTKVEAEHVAAEAARQGAPLIRLYPGVVYGPGRATEGNLVGRLVADHLAGRLPGLIGADRVWSYAYMDDVAQGHVAALERGPSAHGPGWAARTSRRCTSSSWCATGRDARCRAGSRTRWRAPSDWRKRSGHASSAAHRC